MKTKMIKKWAAAAALACITLNMNALAWTYTPGTISSLTAGSTLPTPWTGDTLAPLGSGTAFLIGARVGNNNFAQVDLTTGLVSVVTYDPQDWNPGLNTNLTSQTTQDWNNETTQSLRLSLANSWLSVTGLNTIESGGIMFASSGSITGGSLTAGNDARNLWIVSNNSATISSAIVGEGKGLDITLVNDYYQTFTLSGNNTFTGDVWLRGYGNSAAVNINHVNALGSGQKTVHLISDSRLTFGAGANNGVFNQNIKQETANTMTISSNGNTITLGGDVSVNPGGGYSSYSTANFQSTAGGNLILNGNVDVGFAFLNFGGTVTITGDFYTRYTGGLTVNNGAVYVKDGGKFTLDANSTSFGSVINLENGGEVVAGRNVLTFTNTINQNGGKLSTITSGTALNFNDANAVYNLNGGEIEVKVGASNSAVIMGASGTLNLNGGAIKVSSGNARTMTAGSLVVKDGGGKFDLDTATTLTVQKGLTHGGVNAKDGGLVKSGAGTLILSDVNNYTGDTTVSAGTLQLAGGASLLFQMDDSFGINAIKSTGGLVNLSAGSINIDLSAIVGSADYGSPNTWNLFAGDIGNYTLGSYGVNLSGGDWGVETNGVWRWDLNDANNSYYTFTRATGVLEFMTVPEPSTWLLLTGSVALLAVLRRRK